MYGLVLYVLVALKTNAKVPRIRTTISKVVVSRARQHAESHQVARIRTTSGGQKGTFRRGSQCRTKTCLKIGSNNISILRCLNTQVVISRGKVEVFRAGSNTIDFYRFFSNSQNLKIAVKTMHKRAFFRFIGSYSNFLEHKMISWGLGLGVLIGMDLP